MKDTQVEMINEWIEDSRILLKCYLSKSQKFKQQNRILKIISASISTLLLTLLFIFIRLELMTSNFHVILISVIGLISTILTISIAFLNLIDDANKCDSSGSQYATIRKELEYIKNFEKENPEHLRNELQRINDKWNFVRKNSIPITPKEIGACKDKMNLST